MFYFFIRIDLKNFLTEVFQSFIRKKIIWIEYPDIAVNGRILFYFFPLGNH